MMSLGPADGLPVASPARTVTRQQVDHAVAQLRERRHLPAAEQMRAVLRALDLVVVPDPEIPDPREAPEVEPSPVRRSGGRRA